MIYIQKTIEDEELAKVKNLGIESFVKCTKNSHDEVSGLRSINLNFEIKIDGQLVGKGNNLNINNLTEADYFAILKAFQLDSMDDRVPFVAMLYTAKDKEKIDDWITARARTEKEIDDSQEDVTKDPSLASKKQLKFLEDLRLKKEGGDEEYQSFLSEMEVKGADELNRTQASELIDTLQSFEDRPEKGVIEAKGRKKSGKKKK